MSSLSFKEGSIFGGVLLIAGSCIGAGMLALPVITAIAGFLPSIAMFFLAWLFMTATGFLLLEANLRLGSDLSLISIAEKTLGKWGKGICWVLFLFLFYSLGVAYVTASGSILHDIMFDLAGVHLPQWTGSVLFTIVFGIVIYIGTKPVDYVNRILMVGLVIAYFFLVFLGSRHIHPSFLAFSEWKYSFFSIPILIISFGFHNMIPSLTHYFKGDARRLRITLFWGSLIPLIIYLIWEFIILGIVPLEGRSGLIHSLDKGQAATHALREVAGNSWISTAALCFALFAIITSFLAQSLSLVDFLGDGLKISKKGTSRFFLLALTLIPPLLCAFLYPGIFIDALNFAGGFCAVILFGILPVCMVRTLRRKDQSQLKILPGGNYFLAFLLLFACAILSVQFMEQLEVSFLKNPSELVKGDE